jgi:protein PhnA
MCAHEWNENAGASKPGESPEKDAVRDAHGNVLSDGDSIVLIKDLKLGGSVIKQGTLIKNITLADEAGHNIACRSKEFGSIYLKSEFVKKA